MLIWSKHKHSRESVPIFSRQHCIPLFYHTWRENWLILKVFRTYLVYPVSNQQWNSNIELMSSWQRWISVNFATLEFPLWSFLCTADVDSPIDFQLFYQRYCWQPKNFLLFQKKKIQKNCTFQTHLTFTTEYYINKYFRKNTRVYSLVIMIRCCVLAKCI